MQNLIIKNATIVTPCGDSARKGVAMSELTVIDNGCVIANDGVITYVGDAESMPEVNVADYEVIDAEGRCLLPGFVDSHTHLVFGGYRPDEFEWRLKGDTYMSIMERGGGIQSSVNARCIGRRTRRKGSMAHRSHGRNGCHYRRS